LTHQQRFQALFLALCAGATPCLGAAAETEASAESANVAGTSTGPDVFVFNLPTASSWGNNTVNNELVAGFSVGTDSCNAGDENLLWVAQSENHPVIRQNLYRLRNNRFEQIGTSWVKHGFYATNEDDCSTNCVPFDPGWQLAPGCSDLYSSALNGDRTYLGPSSDVNAFTGEFPWPRSFVPSQPHVGNINYRLQARHADIDPGLNPGSKFFVDGHYVTHDDAVAGNAENNVSHRAARITTFGQGGCPHTFCLVIDTTKDTQVMIPALYAWQDLDPTVQITEQRVPGEGLFILGAHVSDLGDGFWRYEYALYNMNSHRSAGTFRVPIPEDAIVRNIGFHDVSYHDLDGVPIGNPPVRRNYEGTDWPSTLGSDSILWETTPYETEPNANALRWSTLYNFRFEVNAPPEESHVDVGLFRPGQPPGISIRCQGPALTFIDCNMNGIPDLCDVSCEEPGCNQQTCGQFEDCNLNSVPDDPLCEADCNGNELPDECDISDCPPQDLSCADCNGNTVPDGCEDDCDGDGVPDNCEENLDCDDDGFEDCDDACPCNTPPNGCELVGTVTCRLGPQGASCVLVSPELCAFYAGTPMCGEPPEERCEFGYPCLPACREGCLLGDFDSDGDRDFADFQAFQDCFSSSSGGPAFAEPSAECLLRLDFDDDGDIDLADYHDFQGVHGSP
jgi:hypothetical protein